MSIQTMLLLDHINTMPGLIATTPHDDVNTWEWGLITVQRDRDITETEIITEANPADPDYGETIMIALEAVTKPLIARMIKYLGPNMPGRNIKDPRVRAALQWCVDANGAHPDASLNPIPLLQPQADAVLNMVNVEIPRWQEYTLMVNNQRVKYMTPSYILAARGPI